VCLGEKLWLDLLPQGSGHGSGRIHSLQAAAFSTILHNVDKPNYLRIQFVNKKSQHANQVVN
jgi:hypothetical protein